MGIIGWIVLGLLAGFIAKAIMPGDDPGGIIVTIIIGVVGAILGGFLAQVLFGRNTVDEFFDISTWLTAIIGAILLLVIYRLAVGRGGRRRVI
ncbi:MAG TPA: GlsB/YeaQ/YmgE family stress response membrane protein [Actinomycetes bacterium]|nr:GlsB/YeaQ/YmgE family stress response membrane protein [Actinomycetes bacterium]